jgi:threonine/homoserine/homoserine lactone efflux protein
MLSLEAIAVLGFLYLFFMYAMLRATRVEEREREPRQVRELPTKAIPETRPIEHPEVA